MRAKLFWLGHPRIERDGAPVRLDTRKTTALLAYLSLIDHPMSRERLAALFWPDFDQERAPANLRRSLAALRAALPGDWLAAERDRIGVQSSEDLWVDVREARLLIAGVKSHKHDSEEACPDCRTRLEQAVALYQGDFLEGFTLPDCPEFDDWQLAERENIRSDQGWALQRLARAQASAEQWEQALATARRWVSLDRLHEPAQALLIRLLAQSGQRTAAIRHYEEFASLLQRELGAQPDPKTREAYGQDAQGTRAAALPAPAAQTAPAVSTAPEPRKGAAPFEGLLRTKLDVPRLRAARVERERLVDVLDKGIARGLAVVSAPAGFGKSTILAQWAAGAGMPVAWLSLDSGDNDVHRFLLYCAAALDAAKSGLGAAAADLLGAMTHAPAAVVMTGLINSISSEGTDIALVLDDYQFIRAVEIHEAVRFLVDCRPPFLRLVIATREDPPLPLARLRSNDSLAEIRADDLRFTTAEAGRFLNSSMSLSLSEENVARLSKRTEGWIAGLQMAALSLQGREDSDAFIDAFGGTNRYILDYLAEEVFARQDEQTRRFLLETSILGRMSAGLCEALTGRRGAQEMLERLDRANLFLVALDERRCWFRYHHLFGDLLLHRMEHARSVEEIRALRLRAGDWLGANGELAEAIQQYLAAGGFSEAADLIERSYVDILSRGGLGELLRWCREIPDDVTRQRPALGIVAAWALALAGKHEATETALESVERVLQRSGSVQDDAKTRALRGDIAIIHAFLHDLAGNASGAIELTRAAEELLPEDHLIGRCLVFLIRGRAFMYQGDLESADRTFSDFLRFCVALDNLWAISYAVYWLLVLRRLQGSFDGCQQMVREFETRVDSHHSRGSGPLAKTFAVAGELKREQGRLEEAVGMAEDAVSQVEGWGMPSEVYFCLYYLARAQRSLGRVDEALATIEKAGEISRTSTVLASMRTAFDVERVRNWLERGDVASAVAWADQRQQGETESPLNRHIELISLARVRLVAAASNEAVDHALGLLEELTASARRHRWNGLLIDTQLLEAKAKLDRFGPQEAMSAMDEVVRLAHSGGFFQTIIEEGPHAANLLRAGLEAGKWTDPPVRAYVERLLGAVPGSR